MGKRSNRETGRGPALSSQILLQLGQMNWAQDGSHALRYAITAAAEGRTCLVQRVPEGTCLGMQAGRRAGGTVTLVTFGQLV